MMTMYEIFCYPDGRWGVFRIVPSSRARESNVLVALCLTEQAAIAAWRLLEKT